MSKRVPVTNTAVARVQRTVAIRSGGKVPKNSHVGRMQRALVKVADKGNSN